MHDFLFFILSSYVSFAPFSRSVDLVGVVPVLGVFVVYLHSLVSCRVFRAALLGVGREGCILIYARYQYVPNMF